MKCKNCGREIPDNSNFCCYCSSKVAETCNCWVKKEPYNCGQKKCPGYGLYKILSQSKEVREENASTCHGTYN